MLQSSPIGYMHWQPVSISVAGNSESLSEQSSQCSSQPPSPVSERRSSNGIKLTNLKPSTSQQNDDYLPVVKKGRHVVIKTDASTSTNLVTLYDFKDNMTVPLLQEYKNVSSQTKQRPNSLRLAKSEANKSSRHRSKSIDNTQQQQQRKFNDKMLFLKEKFLHSSSELNDNSDNESTPLVSEVSTPSKSGADGVKSSTSTSPLQSSLSEKSLSPIVKYRQTRSEQNLTNPLIDNISTVNGGNNLITPISRTLSETNSLSSLVNSPNSLRSNSYQLLRQNALQEDNVGDCYCDPAKQA